MEPSGQKWMPVKFGRRDAIGGRIKPKRAGMSPQGQLVFPDVGTILSVAPPRQIPR